MKLIFEDNNLKVEVTNYDHVIVTNKDANIAVEVSNSTESSIVEGRDLIMNFGSNGKTGDPIAYFRKRF